VIRHALCNTPILFAHLPVEVLQQKRDVELMRSAAFEIAIERVGHMEVITKRMPGRDRRPPAFPRPAHRVVETKLRRQTKQRTPPLLGRHLAAEPVRGQKTAGVVFGQVLGARSLQPRQNAGVV
jgi:hypothetical protein